MTINRWLEKDYTFGDIPNCLEGIGEIVDGFRVEFDRTLRFTWNPKSMDCGYPVNLVKGGKVLYSDGFPIEVVVTGKVGHGKDKTCLAVELRYLNCVCLEDLDRFRSYFASIQRSLASGG